MNDENVSLKEILLDVSKKLDRFLEVHSKLHTEMAQREAKVDEILSNRKQWGDEIQELRDWKMEVSGQLKLLKWLSSGGALALIGLILKLLGVPVPF